ncbi:hypothetical protein J2X68_007042 [Streptomyces sp. 3330]|uniref:hypothetical protein n=1 Tax=Streptomyces sp. 3330 TaxID=2817755 RepID=UPI002861F195|nr:hypothetical protein [Streptomyces sp. 3330]MDR6980302.1 hypothetical protein [Streptomyces sp. 3330]
MATRVRGAPSRVGCAPAVLDGEAPGVADGVRLTGPGPASPGRTTPAYAAAAAPGDLQACSAPAPPGHAVLSRGVEEQAGLPDRFRDIWRGIGA